MHPDLSSIIILYVYVYEIDSCYLTNLFILLCVYIFTEVDRYFQAV